MEGLFLLLLLLLLHPLRCISPLRRRGRRSYPVGQVAQKTQDRHWGRKSKGEVVEIPFVFDTKRHSQEMKGEEEIKIEMLFAIY